jgi:hypothetical protein
MIIRSCCGGHVCCILYLDNSFTLNIHSGLYVSFSWWSLTENKNARDSAFVRVKNIRVKQASLRPLYSALYRLFHANFAKKWAKRARYNA